ncbi:ABC transporter permease [Streptosporangium minutum]|nr:ABC transporter permease subunit [Streptosporangium minutum]
MQVAAIVFGVTWPVLINAADGARYVDRGHLETAQVFGVNRGRRRLVVLPAAAPKMFAGLRLNVSLALIMMIVSEPVGSTEGIGYRMPVAQSELDISPMWASIALIGLLGSGLNTVFLQVERRVLARHPDGA